jgi:hypothetical protein
MQADSKAPSNLASIRGQGELRSPFAFSAV